MAVDPGSVMLLGQGLNALTGAANEGAQKTQNIANVRLAREQMDFQRFMSDTAHQREVTDLEAAGLNPILSAGGNGSSSPSGAMGANQAPQISMPDFMAYGMSMAQLELANRKLDIEDEKVGIDAMDKLGEDDFRKLKMKLAAKGFPEAELGGKTAAVLQRMYQWLEDQVKKPKLIDANPNPEMFDSSQLDERNKAKTQRGNIRRSFRRPPGYGNSR